MWRAAVLAARPGLRPGEETAATRAAGSPADDGKDSDRREGNL
jgi:hypothetical protein